jgi:hypothetical protein
VVGSLVLSFGGVAAAQVDPVEEEPTAPRVEPPPVSDERAPEREEEPKVEEPNGEAPKVEEPEVEKPEEPPAPTEAAVLPPTKPALACWDAKACGTEGRCAAEGDRCVASSNLACQASELCKLGFCTARWGRCVVGSAEDCVRSRGCSKKGWCTKTGNECTAQTQQDCADSSVCRKHGRCSPQFGRCVADSTAGGEDVVERFGKAGQVVPRGSAHFSYTYDDWDGGEGTPPDTEESVSILIGPGLLVFAVNGLALGGGLFVGYDTYDSPASEAQEFDVGFNLAIAGYVSFSESVGILPQATFFYIHTLGERRDFQPGSQPLVDYELDRFGISVSLPLLFHVTPHAFIGVGPFFFHTLVADVASGNVWARKRTRGGAVAEVGAWF